MSHMLKSLELDLTCEGSAAHWRERFATLGLPLDEENWDVAFWALPGEGTHGLRVRTHMHRSAETSRLHVKLKYDLLPSKPPPPKVREHSDLVGGYPAVLDRLRILLGDARHEAELDVMFFLSPQDLGGISNLFPPKTELLGTAFAPTIVMGRIDPVVDGIQGINILHISDEVWMVGLSRQITTPLHSGIVEVLEKESWSGLTKLST